MYSVTFSPARGDKLEPVSPHKYLYGILNVSYDRRTGDKTPPKAQNSDPHAHITAAVLETQKA